MPTGKIRYDNVKAAVASVVGFSRQRVETDRWTAFRSHYGIDAFYCQPGIQGAHEKGGVEGDVGWFRRNHLVPVEAADDKALSKTIARYGRVDLLCIDDLGYMQLDRRGAELLFQVLTEREEKASVAIVSNESFSGWTKTFTDPRLCAAIVDRLTFDGTIIETGTDSYRLAHTTRRLAAQPS